MTRSGVRILVVFGLGMGLGSIAGQVLAENKKGPVLENLMTTQLESAPGLEVIVSEVALPPMTTLPKHYHPGEEFVYVLDGTATIWLEGEGETELTAGDAFKVPLERPHLASTQEAPARVVVFRVHKTGMEERYPAP